MTQRSAAGDALRAKIRAIVDRPAPKVVAWHLTGEVRGPMVWRKMVEEALADLRLRLVSPKRDWGAERAIFRASIAECIAIRLEGMYHPVFRTHGKIEYKVGALAGLLNEPWAHSKHPVNR